MTSLIGHERYSLLTLYHKAPTLTIGGFVLGSSSSRYTTKTHVMAINSNHPTELHFAKIEHFCKVNYNCSDSTGTTSKWVASVVFYDVHQCYDGPTEVWCRSLSAAGSLYIDLSSIKSRVAYCEADVVISEE